MPNVLLDTGVWFGYFVRDDVFHHDADKLVSKLIASEHKILLPEIERFELLNALTHELLDHERVRQISDELRKMTPSIELVHGDSEFWNEVLPSNLPRLFLKPMDFIIASYALYLEVEEFYSFDERLNRAVRRLQPDIVKVKIRKGRVIFS